MVAVPPESLFLKRVKNGGDMMFVKRLLKKDDIRIPRCREDGIYGM